MHTDSLYMRQSALFTGPTTTLFWKNNIKHGSHGTIHTFKNYFATVFSVFSFLQNKLIVHLLMGTFKAFINSSF